MKVLDYVLNYRLDIRGQILTLVIDFLFFQNVQILSWDRSASYLMGARDSFVNQNAVGAWG